MRAHGAARPGLRALDDKKTGQVTTFGELRRDLDETAAALRAAGLAPGDRVALFVATGPEFVTLVFACFQAGLVPVLIDPGMGADNVLACVKEQAPKGLLGIAKAHALALVFRSAFAAAKVRVLVGGSYFPGSRSLDKLKRAGATCAVHPAGKDALAAILYTSGSTGAPKGVQYTHGMLAGQSEAIRAMFGIEPGEVDVACFLPFGLFSVAMGMCAVFPDMDFRHPAKAEPRKILAALHGATSAFASPALWEPFAQFLVDTTTTLPGLQRVLTAGAPVRPQLHERFLQALPDGNVFTPYGATEALPVAFMDGRSVVAETAAKTRAGQGTCVGRLAPGVTVKILALTDEPIATMDAARALPSGEIGEIVVRGPCVTRRYDTGADPRGAEANARSKIADASVPEGFWHRMGDAGKLDDQGRLWFCGRKGHRVETAQGTLHSIPVEAQVETLWPERAALVGIGERGQQRAVVVVEATKGAPRFDGAELLGAVRALPGCAAVADVLLYVGAFPVDRRHNAKIEREQLARWAASRL
ncbi:MAG: AMP-binding protein [Deltaproteobacteria bacterium]|nr:AMP-binding protein [Deltaproteobacteria bacterium]